MEYEFSAGGRSRKVVINKSKAGFKVNAGRGDREVEYYPLSPHSGILLIDNLPRKVYFAADKGSYYVYSNGGSCTVIEETAESDIPAFAASQVESDGVICAPMPGKILKIHVNKGDRVAAKQRLAIIESMKMEHDICAPLAGTVIRVTVATHDLVNAGHTILEIEPTAEEK